MNVPDTMMPQFALAVGEVELGDDQVMDIMMLEVTTGGSTHMFRLCDADNYRQTADKLAEGIRRQGAEMRAPHKKLITNVRSLPDGLRKAP